MTGWWLICQNNVDEVRNNLDKIINSKTEDTIQSARDALMMLDASLHQSNVKPWDIKKNRGDFSSPH